MSDITIEKKWGNVPDLRSPKQEISIGINRTLTLADANQLANAITPVTLNPESYTVMEHSYQLLKSSIDKRVPALPS